MPRPKPHYRVVVTNLQTGAQLRIELIDLPFATARSFRLRVNGKWARRMPVGSKTRVLEPLRRWWVTHEWMGETHGLGHRSDRESVEGDGFASTF